MHLFQAPQLNVRIVACLFLGLLLLSSACSHKSVRHLNKQIWLPDTEQSLQMQYMRFEYQAHKGKNGIRVQGEAQPIKASLPEWAAWSRDIWLGAYLCDKEGLVLAKDLKMLPAQEISQNQGFSFEFQLEPKDIGTSGPVFITFGYRLVLTAKQSEILDREAEEKIFFASESALDRF
ncbi:MAG: hypothetical protein ACLFMQ_07185 [Desulfohalobiaceae bacterium]